MVDGLRLPVVGREARLWDRLPRAIFALNRSFAVAKASLAKELPRDRYHPPNLRNSSPLGEKKSAPWDATEDPYKLRRELHRERDGSDRPLFVDDCCFIGKSIFHGIVPAFVTSHIRNYSIQRDTLFVMKSSIQYNVPRLRSAMAIVKINHCENRIAFQH